MPLCSDDPSAIGVTAVGVASNRAAARELLSCDGVFAFAAMETVSWSESEYLSMTLSCRPSRFSTTYAAKQFW
jgi:hypothetical protein